MLEIGCATALLTVGTSLPTVDAHTRTVRLGGGWRLPKYPEMRKVFCGTQLADLEQPKWTSVQNEFEEDIQ